jgi:hypothetical protein
VSVKDYPSAAAALIRCNKAGNVVVVTSATQDYTFVSYDYGITNVPVNISQSQYNSHGIIMTDSGDAFYSIGNNITKTSISMNGPACIIHGGLSVSNVVASKYSSASDKRIKKNIKDATGMLNIVEKIKIKKYEYIDEELNESDSARQVHGVIAQELEQVLPEAVTTITEYIPDILHDCVVKLTDQQGIYEVNDIKLEKCAPVNVKILDKYGKVYHGTIIDKRTDSYLLHCRGLNDSFGCLKETVMHIYGSQVTDFKVVDKSKLAVIALGAVKELYEKYRQMEEMFHLLVNA